VRLWFERWFGASVEAWQVLHRRIDAVTNEKVDQAENATGNTTGETGERLQGSPVQNAETAPPSQPSRWSIPIVLLLAVAGVAATDGLFREPSWKEQTDEIFGPSEFLERKSFGETWPYPDADAAWLRCIKVDFGTGTAPRPVVTVEVGLTVYGVNDIAKGLGLPDEWQLLERGEFNEPLYKASSQFIERALKNCDMERKVRQTE
jgi:hypothetical protein